MAGGSDHPPEDPSAPPSLPPVAPHPEAMEQLERLLLGETPHLTQEEIAEQSGATPELGRELWRLLGFASIPEGERAFTSGDTRALQLTQDLLAMGVLHQDRQDGLVRTWGRSFARLAEWQVGLLADVAAENGVDPTVGLLAAAPEVLPRVEELQAYAWRRHLFSVGARLIAERTAGSSSMLAVCFVDIVGYTTQSRTLADRDLVAWLEAFESAVLAITVERGARIIKNIGDELLLVADDPVQMAQIALELARRGAEPDDPFPAVRAGVAYGEVVTRLGDVFGPVVNIASRLTSVARANSVLVDRGMYEALTGAPEDDATSSDDGATGEAAGDGAAGDDAGGRSGPETPFRFRRVLRVSVKGYSRLHVWRLQPAS